MPVFSLVSLMHCTLQKRNARVVLFLRKKDGSYRNILKIKKIGNVCKLTGIFFFVECSLPLCLKCFNIMYGSEILILSIGFSSMQ